MTPSTRTPDARTRRRSVGFAETEFLHDERDADYSGFAPTQMPSLEQAVEPDAAPRPGPRGDLQSQHDLRVAQAETLAVLEAQRPPHPAPWWRRDAPAGSMSQRGRPLVIGVALALACVVAVLPLMHR